MEKIPKRDSQEEEQDKDVPLVISVQRLQIMIKALKEVDDDIKINGETVNVTSFANNQAVIDETEHGLQCIMSAHLIKTLMNTG